MSGVLEREIAAARQVTGLSVEQFAALLELDPSTILAWESGALQVEPAQAAVVARLFGLDLPQFMTTDLRTAPSALLYRSMAGAPGLERLADDRLPHQFGEFLYCVRVVAECEQLAGVDASAYAWLERVGPEPLAAGSRPPHNAEELAARVRGHLGLGDGPIASMQALLRDRGVALFFADADALHPAVDAACTLHPRPAILVNAASGDAWWRTRMSLAHELAHLCFDRDVLGAPRQFFLFSPSERAARAPRAWHVVDRFEALEQRASAFAAYFLAPPAAVRRLISRASAASPAALHEVARHFGVGHETAANILKNVFNLSDVQRSALLATRPIDLGVEHPDRVVRPRLRDETFVARVVALHRDGAIDGTRARRWLQLAAHEPLPAGFGLSPEQEQPLVSPVDRARQRLDYLLRRNLADPSLHVDSVELCGRDVRARVARGGAPGAPVEHVGDVVFGGLDLRVVSVSTPALARLVGA